MGVSDIDGLAYDKRFVIAGKYIDDIYAYW